MDVIPLDASLVRGSHARAIEDAQDGPLVIVDQPGLLRRDSLAATDVKSLVLDAIFQREQASSAWSPCIIATG